MADFTRPLAVETAALNAVRRGRELADTWPDVPVNHDPVLDDMLPDSLKRWAEGDVFDPADQKTITLMLAAVRDTLEDHCAGYGDYLLRACTDEIPLQHGEAEQVRRVGELLKLYVSARDMVIDSVRAERQLSLMRRI